MTARRGQWLTQGLIAAERGNGVDQWTSRITGGGSFSSLGLQMTSPVQEVGRWSNNAGASQGTVEYPHAYNLLGTTNPSGYEDAHTVHMRLLWEDNDGQDMTIGPAVCCHASTGALGNCYYVQGLYSSPNRGLEIRKWLNGVETTISLSQATVDLAAEDVVSLAYRWDATFSTVWLAVMVNGVQVVEALDTASVYRISAITSAPGVAGQDDRSHAAGTAGSTWSEWWVTAGYKTYDELRPITPELTGSLNVELMTRQEFTGDAEPVGKMVFSKDLTACSWTYKRLGGCGRAQVKIQIEDWQGGTDTPSRSFRQPTYDAWASGDWHGGDLRIVCKYSGLPLRALVDNLLYRGRIEKIEVDQASHEIRITAEGYYKSLEERQYYFDDSQGITLRSAFQRVLGAVIKTDASGEIDNPILSYSLMATAGILDYEVDLDFNMVSVKSAIEDLVKLLPPGFTYGVDQHGVFYVQQPFDYYSDDFATNQLAIPTFDADDSDSFKLTLATGDIENVVQVWDKEIDPNGVPVIAGMALSQRSRVLWGTRVKILDAGGVEATGANSRIAQSKCKSKCAPRLTASMRTTDWIQDSASFWLNLVNFAPWVGVILNKGEGYRTEYLSAVDDYKITDNVLRKWGDLKAYLNDMSGESLTWPSTSTERGYQNGFLFHARCVFTTAHPGSTGTDYAFVVGRQWTSPTSYDWGSLVWVGDGKLYWFWYDGTSSVRWDIGITVNAATPASVVVNLSIHRDSNGVWRAYDGVTLKSTDSTNAQSISSGPSDWATHTSGQTGGTVYDWDGAVQEIFLLDSNPGTAPNGLVWGIDTQSGGVAAFLSRISGVTLPRNESVGLVMHAKLNEPADITGSGGRDKINVWTNDGTSPSYMRSAAFSNSGGTTSYLSSGLTQSERGVRIGEGERTWGSNLILGIDSVKYKVEPAAGIVSRDFKLGDIPRDLGATLAGIRREVDRQDEILRTVKEGL